MIPVVLLGAGVGLGVWVAARALAPQPTPLAVLLADLERPRRPLDGEVAAPVRVERWGSMATRLLAGAGLDLGRHRRALRMVGSSAERHALGKLVGGLAGLTLPLVVWLGLGVLALGLPTGMVFLASAALGVGGFVLPDLRLREEAERQRRTFRHALSAYLDLVNVILAGGGGLETALHTAAAAGDGPAFARIRLALDRARRTGRSPWDAFAELGHEVGVAELSELAASVAIAGSQGARIRRSLARKADTLRGHQIAETEAAAEAATERMTIPVAVLLSGFLLLIAYPAVQQITSTTAGP